MSFLRHVTSRDGERKNEWDAFHQIDNFKKCCDPLMTEIMLVRKCVCACVFVCVRTRVRTSASEGVNIRKGICISDEGEKERER